MKGAVVTGLVLLGTAASADAGMIPGMSFKKVLAPAPAQKASTLSLKSPDGVATAKVSLTNSGLAFTASKCVDRNNWCGIYQSSACAASFSDVVSKVEMPDAKGKVLSMRLHQDGTLSFDVAAGKHVMTGAAVPGCVNIVKADYAGVAQGLMFSTPTAGKALMTHSPRGVNIHCAAGFTVDGTALL